MKRYKSPYKTYLLISVILLVGANVFLFWYVSNWNWLLLYFLAINFTVGVLYFWDKIIAKSNRMIRVPELVLHILALLGGSPMALLSQKLFHHKTSKKSFIIIYWLIVLAQAGALVWFLKRDLF